MNAEELKIIRAMYEEMEIVKAMRAVRDYCENRVNCTEPSHCPLYCYCEDNPCYWPLPEA